MNEEMQGRWQQVMELFPDLSETQIHGMIMGAALRALENADFRFSIPLTFTVGNEVKVSVSSSRR